MSDEPFIARGFQGRRATSPPRRIPPGQLATCARCRSVRPVGTLLEYGHAMGVVLRCPDCDALMLRLLRIPGEVRVDTSGITLLVLPDGDAAT
jgi:Family of unknown function (DUF6510)